MFCLFIYFFKQRKRFCTGHRCVQTRKECCLCFASRGQRHGRHTMTGRAHVRSAATSTMQERLNNTNTPDCLTVYLPICLSPSPTPCVLIFIISLSPFLPLSPSVVIAALRAFLSLERRTERKCKTAARPRHKTIRPQLVVVIILICQNLDKLT